MTSRTLFLLLPLVSVAAACGSGSPVDIGTNAGGSLTDYAASWDGYTEAYRFDPASDRLQLILDASGQGTLEVGDQALVPPPTDPNAGYPDSQMYGPLLRGGFLYPVHGAHVESQRIQFTINPDDLIRAWCQLQTPVLDTTNSTSTEMLYGCLPNLGFTGGGDSCALFANGTTDPMPVDCRKLEVCVIERSCLCTAAGCDIRPGDGSILVDAALEESSAGTQLVGTLAIDNTTRITIRMNRP